MTAQSGMSQIWKKKHGRRTRVWKTIAHFLLVSLPLKKLTCFCLPKRGATHSVAIGYDRITWEHQPYFRSLSTRSTVARALQLRLSHLLTSDSDGAPRHLRDSFSFSVSLSSPSAAALYCTTDGDNVAMTLAAAGYCSGVALIEAAFYVAGPFPNSQSVMAENFITGVWRRATPSFGLSARQQTLRRNSAVCSVPGRK